jgi:hypothetical protein
MLRGPWLGLLHVVCGGGGGERWRTVCDAVGWEFGSLACDGNL